MRHVCVVITARASYSRVKTALLAVQASPELRLTIIAGASALLPQYGDAVSVIERDGFKVKYKLGYLIDGTDGAAMAKTTGLGIIELSSVFQREQPDYVVTIADRYETIATAVAASYLNIPLVHIQGGEVTGNIDDKVRNAITKLADVHLVSSEGARQRVIEMGEHPGSIHVTGCPSIDLAATASPHADLSGLYSRYGGTGSCPSLNRDFVVVMQHPVTDEPEGAAWQIGQTLNAVSRVGIPAIVFWPNPDAGSHLVAKAIRQYRERNGSGGIHFFRNLDPKDFLELLLSCKCIVGNSSVGIRECSFMGVPSVNIGTRQAGRDRGPNVIDVPYEVDSIADAIQRQVNIGKYHGVSLYGNGKSGAKVARALESAAFEDLSIATMPRAA